MVTKYLAVFVLVAAAAIMIAPASAVGQCGEQGCGKVWTANCLPTERCVDQGFWKGYNCVADPTCVAVTTTSCPLCHTSGTPTPTPTASCPLCHASSTPSPTPAKAGCTTPTKTNTNVKETCMDDEGPHSDYCMAEGVTESAVIQFYCDAGQCKKLTTGCAAGYKCQNGACVALYPKATPTPVSTAAPSCSETDSGFDYPVKGACTDAGPSAICPAGCTDKCTSGSELNEYYCYAKRCYLKTYSCPSTQKCLDGACVSKDATATPTSVPTKVGEKCKAIRGTCKGHCLFSESDKGQLDCGGTGQYATTCCISKIIPPKPTAVPARTPFGRQSVPVVGTECKTSEKGTCKSRCALTENDKGASDCGTKKSCCVKKTQCDDGTQFNTCNAKGEWCNSRGVLVYGGLQQCKKIIPPKCNNNGICETGLGGETYLTCPKDCPKPGVVQSTQSKCTDGTTKFSCSTATPGQYCNGVGQLVPFARCQMLPA